MRLPGCCDAGRASAVSGGRRQEAPRLLVLGPAVGVGGEQGGSPKGQGAEPWGCVLREQSARGGSHSRLSRGGEAAPLPIGVANGKMSLMRVTSWSLTAVRQTPPVSLALAVSTSARR